MNLRAFFISFYISILLTASAWPVHAQPEPVTPAINAASSIVVPATVSSATEDETVKKVAQKLAEAMKEIANQPEAATADIAPATVEPATKEPAILTGLDKSAEALVDGISNTIQSSRKWTMEILGGPESKAAQAVDSMMAFVTYDCMGWPIWEYILSFLIIFITLSLRQWIAQRLFNAFLKFSKRTKTRIDDEVAVLFEKLLPPFRFTIALFGIYLAVQVFFRGQPPADVNPTVLDQARYLFRAVCFLLLLGNIAWMMCRIADWAIQWLTRLTHDESALLDQTFEPIAKRTVKVFIIVITILQGLDFFNLDTIVNSLLAAAGVSGLAIGLAAQDTIKNFFGSIVLLVDRPFSIGDWIVAGGTEGIVESVGFRSTKIRTFGKTLITIPNSSIVDRDIDNITRRKIRRVKFNLGVSYETNADQMEELLRRIRALLHKDDDVWQNLILVRFTEFGDSSLNIFLYYFTKTTAWDEHLAIRERINLDIMRIIDDLGLEIAYPTRTLYMRQDSPPEPKWFPEPKQEDSPNNKENE